MKNESELRDVICKKLPGRLYRTRIRLGLTQDELAKRAGTTIVSISCYERGTRLPTSDILAGIALALNVSSDWLLGLSGDSIRR